MDDNDQLASPPWTSLRELEHASLQLEQPDAQDDPDYGRWLQMLISPGGSLGGARPKASVRDEQGGLWIAKFPARNDDLDVGAWEAATHELASRAGVTVPEAILRTFSKTRAGSKRHTYLSRRFDRNADRGRIHVASALTLLGRQDGDDASEGASYIELADLLIQAGAVTNADLEQLWRRIVFFLCVSNTDDHLRNHAFVLTERGWRLAPAYDMNPVPHASGLTLNISETDNSLDLELAYSVRDVFRIAPDRSRTIVHEVVEAVQTWREVVTQLGIPRAEQDVMRPAFRVAAQHVRK